MDNVSDVEWRWIPGFEERYQVSNDGQVRSFAISSRPKNLKTRICHRGYTTVGLKKPNKRQKTHKVHRLVLLAFVGKCPEGMESCHNNGVKTDNNVSNLRWDTSKNNHADRILHGTTTRGESSSNSKLTEGQVREIHQRYPEYEYPRNDLGKEYGVSGRCIKAIVDGQTWSWLGLGKSRKRVSVKRQSAN